MSCTAFYALQEASWGTAHWQGWRGTLLSWYESRTTLDNMTNWQLTWNLYPPCWTAKCKWNHSEVIFSTHSCEVEVIMSMCSSTGADIKVGVLNSFWFHHFSLLFNRCQLLPMIDPCKTLLYKLIQTARWISCRSDRRQSTWDTAGCHWAQAEQVTEADISKIRAQKLISSNLIFGDFWPLY
jgi:hypothetical protein